MSPLGYAIILSVLGAGRFRERADLGAFMTVASLTEHWLLQGASQVRSINALNVPISEVAKPRLGLSNLVEVPELVPW